MSFIVEYAHAKMASRKRERYKIEPRIYVPFMLELGDESKIIKTSRPSSAVADKPAPRAASRQTANI